MVTMRDTRVKHDNKIKIKNLESDIKMQNLSRHYSTEKIYFCVLISITIINYYSTKRLHITMPIDIHHSLTLPEKYRQ